MLTRFAKIGNVVGVERVMKSRVQISRLAVVCVMCASAVSGAFGAASVRSLGGSFLTIFQFLQWPFLIFHVFQ